MLDSDNPSDNPSDNSGDNPGENTPVNAEPAEDSTPVEAAAPARKTAARKTAKKAAAKRTTKKAAAAPPVAPEGADVASDAEPVKAVVKKATRKRATRAAGATPVVEGGAPEAAPVEAATDDSVAKPAATAVLFQAPDQTEAKPPRKRATRKAAPAKAKVAPPVDAEVDDEGLPVASAEATAEPSAESVDTSDDNADNRDDSDDDGEGGARRRPRRRGGRRRRKGANDGEAGDEGSQDSADDETSQRGDRKRDGDDGAAEQGDGDSDGDSGRDSGRDSDKDTDGDDEDTDGDGSGSTGTASRRRRRRRRGAGDDSSEGSESGSDSGSGSGGRGRGRRTRNAEDEITAISGSTRLEAKRQRRREGREAGRRRAPIVSEAEFLARREAVDRVMVIRQRDDLTQIAVIEDKVLVEHYVARASQTSLIGNVYLGRVQNVLPSMEAAFIDIGKGRNAVLYAGEVNWTALGAKDGQPRKIESVLKSGQPILVQVSKDPIGHKGARLTSQVSLPGRFLVYVPDGTTSGISRKLPENERTRLKTLLKEIVPDTAGVIVRTAAEGASEEELTQDVERLTARWADIEEKIAGGQSPQLLYGEPDLTLKVVRDLFTEDFTRLVVQGDDAWDLVDNYVAHVAPDLRERLERYSPEDHDGIDLFGAHRLDEQIAKGVDRKVWLPSGGSLVIDRTEAMTVVDVNTGKFTGSGGNLEETVTKNNLEAAEEFVRQLRLRDIGGIIVVDFIDMVLESNRDLVLRRMVECLGRDRTRHQVAEVTSLGLVQMTRKRIGTGLLEAFSEECEACKGRGLTLHEQPIEPSAKADEGDRRGGRRGRGRGRGENGGDHHPPGNPPTPASHAPSPKDVAAVARPENADRPPLDEMSDYVPYQFPDDLPDEFDDVSDDVDNDLSDEPEISHDTEAEVSAEVVTAEAAVVEATLDVATPDETHEPVTKPVGERPEADAAPVEAVEPEEQAAPAVSSAPKLVTTTRRRSARRAAGPPPVVEAPAPIVATAEDGSGDEDDELETDEAGFVLHVPVKKKGVRKR